jgi:hypothetical protein
MQVWLPGKDADGLWASIIGTAVGHGRVARPFGFALTEPGMQISRTRLFPEATRVKPHVTSRGEG